MYIVGTVAHALGMNLKKLIISKSAIRNARVRIRKQECERIKELFENAPITYLIVHWDGKLIPDDIQCKKIDRLPIIVSTENLSKFIAVPALDNGCGLTIASAVYAALKEWGASDLTVGLCCDTTAANFGYKGGASPILEQLLGKDLVYLACRHHVLEILLSAAFQVKVPGTSGPNVAIFKRFQNKWDDIDKSLFRDGLSDLDPQLKEEIPGVVSFIKTYLEKQQHRSDYKELLWLSLAFLGEAPEMKFKRPRACHHAKWMSKAIYSLKMYLCRDPFGLKKTEIENFKCICQFIVFVYLKPWYTSTLAIAAPNNDLNLIKSLLNYKVIDESIAEVALQKLKNYLWYLVSDFCQLLNPRLKCRMALITLEMKNGNLS